MKNILSLVCFFFFVFPVFAQEDTATSKTLDEVTLKAFELNRKENLSAASIKIIEFTNGDRYNKTSLVNGFNTVAGVRMEERSPGSYRINIRGSSLRSPFGVRNVKVYWNGIPVTDPGGNTYFNQFAWNNFSHIEIFKGPAGSMYGAGTGGLILLENFDSWQPGISLEYVTGSYNLQNIFTSARFGKKRNMSQVSFAHNQSDGYRVQSRLRRDNFSWMSKLKITERQEFSVSLLFTDMYYQTPGALTLSELNNDPKAARPAAGTFPSAQEAQAAIGQVNFLLGFNHRYKITPSLTNLTTFYGAYNQIKNPAIRNYERRIEPGFGGRSLFTLEKKKENYTLQLTGGTEFQHGIFNTRVFKNRDGNPDSLQTDDDIAYTNNTLFVQGDIALKNKWIINTGISLNKTRVGFTRHTVSPSVTQSRTYKNELAPRLSVKKMFAENFSAMATVSRGFSPPTISELLPSNSVISTHLEAEYGWNYEMALRTELCHRKLALEATGFYFRLNNALVQRRDSAGADFFVNAGNVKQKGAELSASYLLVSPANSPVDYLQLNLSYAYNHFRYGSFVRNNNDFSGNVVPSVPFTSLSVISDIQLKKGIYANFTYYKASKIFLNDANTAFANGYHLLGGRFGWKKTVQQKIKLNLYAGVDNLLNEMYSLGNDINAFGGRFYNTAPPRNYYIGVSFQWIPSRAN